MTTTTAATRIMTRHELEDALTGRAGEPLTLAETWNKFRLDAAIVNGRIHCEILSYRGTDDVLLSIKEWDTDAIAFAYQELFKISGTTKLA